MGGMYDTSGLYKIIKQKDVLLARAAGGAARSGVMSRTSDYAEMGHMPLEWFLVVRARGRKRVVLSLCILQHMALQISGQLCIRNFADSNGFIQNWEGRHGLVNVSLRGTGASEKVAETPERTEEIGRKMERVHTDLIYSVDEARLLYRGLPSRS